MLQKCFNIRAEFFILSIVIGSGLMLQACTEKPVLSEDAANDTDGGGGGGGGNPGGDPGPGDPGGGITKEILRDFKPALATRSASCLMCHANIVGNLITDFGYSANPNDNWFMGGVHAAGGD